MYFDKEKNAREYIKMVEAYEAGELIEILAEHVAPGAEVLELGMGPGKDLDLLRERFTATGTDGAQPFLDIYLESHPGADVFQLDAVSLNTSRIFDAIFSNKVLIHLTRDDLVTSFANHGRVLRPGGIALHSFWYGTTEEDMNGLHFTYHDEQSIQDAVAAANTAAPGNDPAAQSSGAGPLTIVEMNRYSEFEPNDSLWVVLAQS